MDPRLETIVERMLEKYDIILPFAHILLCITWSILLIWSLLDAGVFLMGNTNRPWVWLLNAGDWISWRKQLFIVIIFTRHFRIVSTFLINMSATANIVVRYGHVMYNKLSLDYVVFWLVH